MSDPDAPAAGFVEKRDAKYRDLRQVVEESKDRRRAGKAHIYALEIPMSVIVGAVGGQFVDHHFGVAPWGITVGLLAGVGAAVRAIVNLIRWMKVNDEEDLRDAAQAATTTRITTSTTNPEDAR